MKLARMALFALTLTILAAVLVSAQGTAPQILNVSPVGTETFKGKGTDQKFPEKVTIKTAGEPVTLKALGSGLRKKLMFKVYEGVLYADVNALLGTDPYDALVNGDFAKRVEMHFLRDVDGGKIRETYEEGFAKTLPGDAMTPELEKDKATFLGFFTDAGVKDGQTIEITWMPGMGLYVMMPGRPCAPIADPAFARALFGIWFGPSPASTDLKSGMVRFVKAE
jgi:hypothetical protein